MPITHRRILMFAVTLAALLVAAAALQVAGKPTADFPPPDESPVETPGPSPSVSPAPSSPALPSPNPSPPPSPSPSPQEPPEESPEPEDEENPEEEPEPSPEPEESPEPEPAPEPEPEPEAVYAPDFVVSDHTGNLFRLSDFRGRPVVLNFWANWCDPCQGEMDAIQTVYEEYGDRVEFLMVNIVTYETAATAWQLFQSTGYTYPVYFDTEGRQAAAAYEAVIFPTTIWIDAKGQVFNTRIGKMHVSVMRERLEELLQAPA